MTPAERLSKTRGSVSVVGEVGGQAETLWHLLSEFKELKGSVSLSVVAGGVVKLRHYYLLSEF